MPDSLNAWFSDDQWWNNNTDYMFNAPPPSDVNEVLFGPPGVEDLHAQQLFTEAMFEKNTRSYIDLVDYMWRQYNIDFEDAFSWSDFRTWYEATYGS